MYQVVVGIKDTNDDLVRTTLDALVLIARFLFFNDVKDSEPLVAKIIHEMFFLARDDKDVGIRTHALS